MKISAINYTYNSTLHASTQKQNEANNVLEYKKSQSFLNDFAAFSALRNQKLFNLSFKALPTIVNEHPIYSSLNTVSPSKNYQNIQLREYLSEFKDSDGSPYFKDSELVSRMFDGLRSKRVLDFQLSALQKLTPNPKFNDPDDLIKFVSQINTVERGELFVAKAQEYSEKYPDITGKELLAIIQRLEPDKIKLQEQFIDRMYMKTFSSGKVPLDDFSELLSTVEDESIAEIQLTFFEDLMQRKNITPAVAINLVNNIEDRKHGLQKKVTGLRLLNEGIKAEDLLILLPKIRSQKIARLFPIMCNYLHKTQNMDSATTASIMANIPNECVYFLQKSLIEEMTALRDFEGIDILKILGDIQTPETAELKSAVIKELAKIEKLNGHDIMHIVTNVDNIYSAEVKVKTAQELAQIEDLSGDNIGYIVAGCHNEENSLVKCRAARELIQIPGMTGKAVTSIASRLLKDETADVQISAAKELAAKNKFTPTQIASIVRHMRNIDFKEAKMKAIETLSKQEKLDNEAIVRILTKIDGESKDKYLLGCIDKMCKNPTFTTEDIANIASTMSVNKHTCYELIDFFATIPHSIRKDLTDYSVVQDFYPFINNKYLNKNERRDLLLALVKHHGEILDGKNKAVNTLFPFLPKTSEEYCQLLPMLAKSIYKVPKNLSLEATTSTKNYPSTILRLARPNSEILDIDFENPENRPTLEYPRKQFIEDIKNTLAKLPPIEQEKMCDQFGFTLEESKGKTIIKGYPRIPDKFTYGQQYIAERKEITELIRKFTETNTVKINGSRQLSKDINIIFQAIPELFTLVEKQQNDYHHFDSFTHTMRVVQEVIRNENINKLRDKDKIILVTAALLHDISKEEYVVDKRHSLTGAFDAYTISERFKLTPADRSKLFAVIRNHEWLKHYNKEGASELQKIERAKTIAFSMREGNAFELVKILSEADLKGMQRNEASYHLFKEAQVEGNNEVARYIRDLQRTAIVLPQYKLPKASQLIPDNDVVRYVNIGGIRNKVIYLRKDMEKGSLPFDRELDPNDFNVLVHSLDSEKNAIVFQCLDESIPDSLISTSYVNLPKGNWKTYRQQGFILDVNSEDIHAAYYKDYGSGLAKSIDKLKLDYLFEGYFKPQRDYISRKIKETLHISDDNYRSLYQHIKNKSLVEIRKEYPFVSAALKKIFMDMQGGEYTYGRNYNEILVTRPRIQGVFAYDRSITQVPRYLRKYALEQDIPIIIFLD